MTDIAPFVVGGIIGLAGVVLTSGVQVFINNRTYRQQTERDTVAYARQVADAKRERLIRRYELASRAAETYFSVVYRMMSMAKEDWTSLAADDRRGLNEIQEVKAYLALEDDTDDVIKLLSQLQADFFLFRRDAERGDFKNESFDKTLIALREALRAHLKAV